MGDFYRVKVDDENDKHEKDGTRNESKPEFSEDEEMLMARMYRLVGPRWSLIAGRIPGRSAQEIEKYFNAKYASTSNQGR